MAHLELLSSSKLSCDYWDHSGVNKAFTKTTRLRVDLFNLDNILTCTKKNLNGKNAHMLFLYIEA